MMTAEQREVVIPVFQKSLKVSQCLYYRIKTEIITLYLSYQIKTSLIYFIPAHLQELFFHDCILSRPLEHRLGNHTRPESYYYHITLNV